MLKEEFRQLQRNGVVQLCQTSSTSESVLVQVYNISVVKGKLACYISDGRFCLVAFLKDKTSLVPEKHDNAIIRIKQHMVNDSGKKLGIIDFDMVCQYAEMIGSPTPLDLQTMNNPQESKTFEINIKNIKTKYINMIDEKTQSQQMKSSQKTVEKKQEIKTEVKKQMRVPEARPLSGNVKDYETIKGLFIGLKNWHLLCRITQLNYQEFKKKNSDKQVRMLTLELMDRSEVKISGTFFYEAADKFKDYLKLDSVYKISEGQISNQNYNNSRNQKLSPFRLIFNVNSIFQEVSDVNIIAKSEDSAITLNDVLNRMIFDQQFDIIGILTQIEDPKELNKGDKVLTKYNWVIVDPVQKKRIHAVLWNDKLNDTNLIGRTVILSRFVLHNYNGSLTLNTKGVKSSVKMATGHYYISHEDQVMRDFRSYELLSQRRIKQEDNSTGNISKNLKELNYAIQTLSSGETIKSDLDIFVNKLFLKKWNYEGCPSCNKAAEKGTTCHCGKYVDQTIPHFIMGIELSDAFGSVYSTAYDEQSKKIFWDEEGVIHKLMKFDEKQLKDVVEDYFYQQFKMRMYTKRDNEGRIKHNMGRLQPIAPQKFAMDNVEKIRELMGKMMG